LDAETQGFLGKTLLNHRLSRYLKGHVATVIRVAVAVLALWLVFRGEDFRQIGRTFLGLNWLLFAGACLLYMGCQLLFVVRWMLLLKTQQVQIGYITAVKLHLVGLFYNNCLPGAVGGDFLRAWYITHHTDKKMEAALSVFVDRALGLGCSMIMAAVFYLIVLKGDTAGDYHIARRSGGSVLLRDIMLVGLAAAAVVVTGLGVAFLSQKGRKLLTAGYSFVRVHAHLFVRKMLTAARLYCTHPLTLLAAVGITLVIQALSIVSIWIICSERGIDAPLKYYLSFFPISWVVGALPISVGGAGITEGVLKVLFAKVATVAEGQRIIPGLVQRVVWLIVSVPGLMIHVGAGHLPATREEVLAETEEILEEGRIDKESGE
jgi:hypothetical protein